MQVSQFYHIKNSQGTKTSLVYITFVAEFYHIKNSQGTKTSKEEYICCSMFYHIKNSQGTKTFSSLGVPMRRFITLRIHRVPKLFKLN